MVKQGGITVKTINDSDFEIKSEDHIFNKYQPELTIKLDSNKSEFTQEIINEIVLWKVNRYAQIKGETLIKINSIESSEILNEELTKDILTNLLNTKGIQLAMASTILRFKNPKIYQIIDQRIFRVLYGCEDFTKKKIFDQIDLYIKYLSRLREESDKRKIPFEKMDRVLYNADKHNNKEIPLKNYGSTKVITTATV